jgi:hypothetical protein
MRRAEAEQFEYLIESGVTVRQCVADFITYLIDYDLSARDAMSDDHDDYGSFVEQVEALAEKNESFAEDLGNALALCRYIRNIDLVISEIRSDDEEE